jgi:hypothetical protein
MDYRRATIHRHDDPSDDIRQQAQTAAQYDSGGYGQPDECNIDIEILGQAGANTGDFLVVHQAIDAPRGAVAWSALLVGLGRLGHLVAAGVAVVVPVADLGAAVGAVHGSLLSQDTRYGRAKFPVKFPEDVTPARDDILAGKREPGKNR